MRRFVLVRHEDVTGLSGTGVVAEGVEFSDGRVATRWLAPVGKPAQTCVWDRVDDVNAVHGHAGATVLRWLDEARISVDPVPTVPHGQPTLDEPGPDTPVFDSLLRPVQPPAA